MYTVHTSGNYTAGSLLLLNGASGLVTADLNAPAFGGGGGKEAAASCIWSVEFLLESVYYRS